MPRKNETILPNKYINDEPLYSVWCGMKSRCYNPNTANYKWYGAKGVSVCAEWLSDFMAFYNWSLANGYTKGLTIDRKNNELPYCPSNCHWVTMKIQNQNRRVPKRYNKKPPV